MTVEAAEWQQEEIRIMNPPVPEELISAYFDGEVTPEERAQVEQMLENSGELRQFLDDTAKLSALLHSFPREATPSDLAANVQKRIESAVMSPAPAAATTPARRGFRRELIAVLVGVAATAAVIVFATSFGLNNSDFVHRYAGFAPRPEASPAAAKMMTQAQPAMRDSAEYSLAPAAQDSPTSLDGKDPLTLNHELSANQPAPTAVPQMDSDVQLSMMNPLGFSNEGVAIAPEDVPNFISRLKRGDFVYQQIIDENQVAVLEMTVVDVEQGADEMMLLLSKNGVRHAENDGSMKENRSGSQFKKSTRKKTADPGQLMVFFVKAPGAKVAETLDESLRENPKLYKRLGQQMPVPLELTGNQIAGNGGIELSDAASQKESGEVKTTELSVEKEAPMIVGKFADLNGFKVDELESLAADSHRPEFAAARRESSKDKEEQARRVPEPAASKLESVQDDPAAVARTEPAQNPAEGYSYYHVAVDNSQKQQMQSRSRSGSMNGGNAGGVESKQNFQAPLLTGNMIPGNTIGNNSMNSLNNSGYLMQGRANPGRQMLRQNSDNRDPKVVRMLIVLKSEAPATPPQP